MAATTIGCRGWARATLVGVVDDADGYLLMLGEIIKGHGDAVALYSGRHGIFQRPPKEPERLRRAALGEEGSPHSSQERYRSVGHRACPWCT